MYRIKDIQDGLQSLVGWEQSYNPNEELSEELTRSESGLTFQGAHPLLTLNNIASIVPDDYILRYPEWVEAMECEKGTKVRYNDNIYIATIDTSDPPSTESSWKRYNVLNDYLTTATRNGIAQAVQTFATMKQLQKESRNLLERRTFFDGAGRINATLENRQRLVGFEIIPVRSMGVTAKINRIGLQMVGGVGKVKVYLFHSSQVEPLRTFELEYTKTNGGFQWFDVADCYLPYISSENNSGGNWYLCYNQDDLPNGMKAINFNKDWSREPCGTCNQGNLMAWRELTKYLQISPFAIKAPTTFAEYPEMWDIADNVYTNTHNYGLNVDVSVGCDITDFIVSQRSVFASVIQKQVAATLLRTMALNPDVRVNRNQSNASKMDLLYEIDGNTQGRPSGLGYELQKAYEALSIDTQGIDRICLSCNNHGVRYTTI